MHVVLGGLYLLVGFLNLEFPNLCKSMCIDLQNHQKNVLIVVFLLRASYKGFADCIRLLLFMDACLDRVDKEGV